MRRRQRVAGSPLKNATMPAYAIEPTQIAPHVSGMSAATMSTSPITAMSTLRPGESRRTSLASTPSVSSSSDMRTSKAATLTDPHRCHDGTVTDDAAPLPTLDDLLATARVVALPLVTRFRGIDVREAMLFEGPEGWTEFSPFAEYGDQEASAWLAAAIDFGWTAPPPALRDRIPVNATVPAVDPDSVGAVLARFPGCRTAKVKVAGGDEPLSADVARVRAVRHALGPEGRIRVDANGGWNVDEAEHAIHALAPFDLEYVEQPCATLAELAEIGVRVKYMGIPIAADESVRRADDPLAVAEADAADLLVIKAQPLGGIRRALRIIEAAGLPVVVSSALDTSVGLAMGAWAASAVPDP